MAWGRGLSFVPGTVLGATEKRSHPASMPPRGVSSWARWQGKNGLTPIAAGVSPFAQKAPAPFGVPRPVGPSQPVRALHHWVVGQEPLLPLVTSNSELTCPYGSAFA